MTRYQPDYDSDSAESFDSADDFSGMESEKTSLLPLFNEEVTSYGSNSIESFIPLEERIVYSWKDMDVYCKQKVKVSFMQKIKRKLCRCCRKTFCCCRKENTLITKKHLLKKISGIAYGGEVLAIMGSSGAGKTTLMNALSFRSPPGIKILNTSIRSLNGVPVNSKTLRSKCAYVQQDDLFIGSLTTKEHLIFQALLRMGRNIPYQQKMNRVNEVIAELSLSKCVNTKIGIPGRTKGLSGGERKRLSFASETLTDPHLLLCDEPTSGLDYFMALNVLQVLKRLTLKGKTIILTIHQPSSEIYNLFDKILLIAEGRTAFLGTPAQATQFFSQLDIPCPVNFNPADYFVKILAIEAGKEQECRTRVNKICDSFAGTSIADEIYSVASKIATPEEIESNRIYNKKNQIVRASWLTQLFVITWRAWKCILKEPMLIKVRLFQTISIALMIGGTFYGQKIDNFGAMNINGAIFLFLTNMTFQNVFSVINVFTAEIPIFMQESRTQLYRSSAYFLGNTFAEMPLFLLLPIIFMTITYFMIGLREGWIHFVIAVGIIWLIVNVSTSFGYLISCASSSISIALSIASPIITPFLIFGGFFMNTGSVPEYFKWLSYTSWFRYGNEALLINQWHGVTNISCYNDPICLETGDKILEALNFDPNDFLLDILALVGLIVGLRFLAFLFLLIRARNKD